MADDDLDDFFDQVEEVEAKALQQEEEEPPKEQARENEEEPPAKKQKIIPPIKRGVVVAAASAATTSTASTTTTPNEPNTAVPPPPPPPPTARPNNSNTTSHIPTAPVPPFAQPPPPPPPPVAAKPVVRQAAGKTWVDEKIGTWPDNDFRLFVGNLGPEVTDQSLLEHFASQYPTCLRARVIRDKEQNHKGYGFVSFDDPLESARAMRKMDQTWLGSRPIRVKRSQWKDRNQKKGKKRR